MQGASRAEVPPEWGPQPAGIPSEVLVKIAQTRKEFEEELTRIFVKGWPQHWGEAEALRQNALYMKNPFKGRIFLFFSPFPDSFHASPRKKRERKLHILVIHFT